MFNLKFEPLADLQLKKIKHSPALDKQYKAVSKSLKFLSSNPRHGGLQTHRHYGKTGAEGEKVFEAYAENNTPGAYRIFWHYGPAPNTITVLEITPHPD